MRRPWQASSRRRAAWGALVAGVTALHGLLAWRVAASVVGWNGAAGPRRIEVSLVQRLQPTAPPPVAAAPAAPPSGDAEPRAVRAKKPARPASAASAAVAEAPASAASSSREALRAEALALAASVAAASEAASSVEAPASAASAPTAVAFAASAPEPVAGPARAPFRWPPSTRLTYTLTGMRHGGNLYGNAAVEWRRQGDHYQVQFDIHVTPFIDQHMFSDGRIVEQGLSPSRYDETYKVVLSDPVTRHILFDDDTVTLTNGAHVPRLPSTQDGASQFVQFVWLFATHPELLRSGNVVEIPLALMSRLSVWRYEVLGKEMVPMPFGEIEAVHLKPILSGPRRSGEYPFELWMAPTLQYLPVRILVTIDDRTYADLTLDALPLQAAPASEASSGAADTH